MNRQEASLRRITNSQTQAMEYAVLCNDVQICRKQTERMRLIGCVRHRQALSGMCQTGLMSIDNLLVSAERDGRTKLAPNIYDPSLTSEPAYPTLVPALCVGLTVRNILSVREPCEALGTHEV